MNRIVEYETHWKSRGYEDGIPDEVPCELMNLGLAPSYKAIAVCILKNDIELYGLGFSRKKTGWYSRLKRAELGIEDGETLFPEFM